MPAPALAAPPVPRLPEGVEVVVFDTETTGCTGDDRVVSLGAVRLDAALEPVATLHLVFAPGRRCHPGAARVHGMSDRFLARQPPFAAHAREVAAFFAGAVGCAHNLSFDRRMLGGEFDRLGLRSPWQGEYCTLRAWRRHRPGGSAGLAAASAAIGLSREDALHGALEDAGLATQLLRVMHGLPVGPMRLHDPTNLR
ncbi:3'-5' exonuclease [Roseomonas sp. OT10]|uniref:3'-5' exonuclease n=1 Tax=Roseomonas cutis TaxID=2897332 RepID=UPI001E43E969|nr:3'-5' exonuclease [Roseomonas sp. OT10]UFN46941.1 3'-5' exonuclease [Roseomonas sp. OT10]